MTTWPDPRVPADGPSAGTRAVVARALAGLFPPVRVEVAAAWVRTADPALLPPSVREEAPARAGAARLRAYAAGRLAASLALARLGRDGWPARDACGRPSWPAGVHGSISHTTDLAVCAVGPAAGPRIGVDVERADRVLDAGDLLAAICRRRERELLPALPDPRAAALALLCAKEAVYKALPPELQPGLPLSAVVLRPSAAGPPQRFTAAVAGATARVAVTVAGGHVLAAAVCGGGQGCPPREGGAGVSGVRPSRPGAGAGPARAAGPAR